MKRPGERLFLQKKFGTARVCPLLEINSYMKYKDSEKVYNLDTS